MTIYRDDLERVYALIERPEAWTQQTEARNADGCPVSASDPDARQWCLVGAALHVGINRVEFYEMIDALGTRLPMEFNDNQSHSEVLALLKSTIERAPVRP